MDIFSKPILFLATSDTDRARDFYENTLQLPCLGDQQWALSFQVGDNILRIQKVDQVAAPPYTALGWQVEDIEKAVAELTSRDVSFEHYPGMPQDEHGIMTIPGQAKIAWFKDPDGHTLSLTES